MVRRRVCRTRPGNATVGISPWPPGVVAQHPVVRCHGALCHYDAGSRCQTVRSLAARPLELVRLQSKNYADLEHKEVWQTYLVMSAFLPSTFFYSFLNVDRVFDFLLEVVNIPLLFILLWRVETLQDLEESAEEPFEESVEEPFEDGAAESAPATQFAKIELMLQQNCIDTQYYLQHDLSLTHLAKHIGTNSTYLSRYFAYKGITYNTYINTLRIEHFMRLYQTTIKTRQYVTAAELSYESGYKSYSTFSVAFKQINGQTVKSWMKQQE